MSGKALAKCHEMRNSIMHSVLRAPPSLSKAAAGEAEFIVMEMGQWHKACQAGHGHAHAAVAAASKKKTVFLLALASPDSDGPDITRKGQHQDVLDERAVFCQLVKARAAAQGSCAQFSTTAL